LLRKKKLVLILTVLVFALVSVVGCGGSDTNEPSDGAQSVKDKLGGRIIGIDPGAGIMAASEKALIEYELDYELVEGSDATMVATLKQAIDNNKWVVVTGWAPHWKFATWDLKFLDDPKGVYGEAETINTIVRKGLKEDLPEVYEICDNFAWGDADIGSAMGLADELGDDVLAARQWVEENQDLVNTWLPQGYDAGSTVDKPSKEQITLLYVEWACARAETHVMADVLQNIMGYQVELMSVGAAAMYEGLAAGQGDACFTAWLPLTHGEYMKQVGDKVEDLGPSYEGARIGLVVPSYVDIDSIEELNN
jgi:glycine betaine/proline transport system substrate-binding protein